MIKTSHLRVDFKKMVGVGLPTGSYLSTTAQINRQTKSFPPKLIQDAEVQINEQLQFVLSNLEIKRDTKCYINIFILRGTFSSLYGKVELRVMDYQNYSKRVFPVTGISGGDSFLSMSVSISSCSLSIDSRSSQLGRTGQESPKNSVSQEEEVQYEPLRISEVPLIVITPEQKEVSRSEERPKQWKCEAVEQKGSGQLELRSKTVILFDNSSDEEIMDNINNQSSVKIDQPFGNDSPTSDQLSATNRGKFLQDSHYCKQIENNLLRFSALALPESQSNISNKVLHNSSAQSSIFMTLNRMKSKFQRIQEEQAMLNSEATLGEVPEGEEYEYQAFKQADEGRLRQSLISFRGASHCHSPDNQFLSPQKHLHNIEESNLNKSFSMVINDDESGSQEGYIYGHWGQMIPLATQQLVVTERLRICRNISIKMPSKMREKQEVKDLQPRSKLNKYKLTLSSKEYPKYQTKEANPSAGAFYLANQNLTQTHFNFQVEKQSLESYPYMKLNKVHDSQPSARKCEEDSRKTTQLLIKANEELQLERKKAEQKLDISRMIISQKEQMLNEEFQRLSQQMEELNQKLVNSNAEAKKREARIRHLSNLQQDYIREINQLKEALQMKNKIIKELKLCLMSYEEQMKLMKSKQQQGNIKLKRKDSQEDESFKNEVEIDMCSTLVLPSARFIKIKRQTSMMSRRDSITNSILKRNQTPAESGKSANYLYESMPNRDTPRYIHTFNKSTELTPPKTSRSETKGRVLVDL